MSHLTEPFRRTRARDTITHEFTVSGGARALPRYHRSFMSEFLVEFEQEEDGRWIAEIPQLSGVMAYGSTRDEAVLRAEALAFRVLADRIDHGESFPEISGVFTVAE